MENRKKIEKKFGEILVKSIIECMDIKSEILSLKKIEKDVDELLVDYKNNMIETIIDVVDKLKSNNSISSAFDDIIKLGIQTKSYRDYLCACIEEVKEAGENVKDYIEPKEEMDKRRNKLK